MTDSLLAEAHERLPPANRYFPLDNESSRQGRWRAQAEEALREYGYAYFLLGDEAPVSLEGVGTDSKSEDPKAETRQAFIGDVTSAGSIHLHGDSSHNDETIPHYSAGRGRPARMPRAGRPLTAEGLRSAHPLHARKLAAEKQNLEQSRGLTSELKRAIKVGRTTLKEADRVESRWRRPTRLDKPRLDPGAWHPGCIVAVHKDGRVDIVFHDGDKERLSGIPAKHVRLAPLPSSSSSSPSLLQSMEARGAAAASATGAANVSTTPAVLPDLSSASRRELAYIATATASLRSTWVDPITMDEELIRLGKLQEEKIRGRPEWRGSFPAVSFETARRSCIGDGGSASGKIAKQTKARAAKFQRVMRKRRRALDGIRRSTRQAGAGLAIPNAAGREPATKAVMDPQEQCQAQALDGCDSRIAPEECSHRSTASSFATPLMEAQANLVSAAVAYDRCIAEVHECSERGTDAFRGACTYSEQQVAFEETTANLGPAQPARAGYTDWRGSPVVGLHNATLDVVEAIDAWTTQWVSTKKSTGTDAEQNGASGFRDEDKEASARESPLEAPPFFWGGAPLVTVVVDHCAKLLAQARDLKEWYGPGFPFERNPFFLAYPLDDRPETPRDALVRTYANGEVSGAVWGNFKMQLRPTGACLTSASRRRTRPIWSPRRTESLCQSRQGIFALPAVPACSASKAICKRILVNYLTRVHDSYCAADD